jgi:hypothetical protein
VFLPEVLRVDPITMQIVFGGLLVICIMALPQGIAGTVEQLIATRRTWLNVSNARRYIDKGVGLLRSGRVVLGGTRDAKES